MTAGANNNDAAARQQLQDFAVRTYGPQGAAIADEVSDRWEAMTLPEREARINLVAGGSSHV